MDLDKLKAKLKQDRELAYERLLGEKSKRKAERKVRRDAERTVGKSIVPGSLPDNYELSSSSSEKNVTKASSSPVASTSRGILQEAQNLPKTLQDVSQGTLISTSIIFRQTKKNQKTEDKVNRKKCHIGAKSNLNEKLLAERRKRAAERKRKQRERLKADPERCAQEKEKERLRSAKRRAEGKIKTVGQMKKRELNLQRKKWRQAKQRQKNKKSIQRQAQNVLEVTPPNSPSIEHENNSSIRRSQQGRRKVKLNRSRVYRKVTKLSEENKRLSALLEKWKKRFIRCKNKKTITKKAEMTPSPGAKINEIMRKGNDEIRKKLYFGEILSNEIRKSATQTGSTSQKRKRDVVKYFNKAKLKRYRCLSQATDVVSRYLINQQTIPKYTKLRRNYSTYQEDLTIVKHFLEKDCNSCILPGKRDTITKGKVKKQKRYLLDTLRNLHKKFIIETERKCSYAHFCRLKPFWFVKQDVTKRDTCLCKKCANMKFIVQKLNILKLSACKIFELPSKLCCDEKTYECMYGHCENCLDKRLYNLMTESNATKTFYYQWLNRKETRSGKGGAMFIVNIVVKEKVYCTVEDMFKEINRQIPNYLKHIYNIRHQQTTFSEIKSHLTETEIALVVDFSENYNCKYQSEIQSAHFGASKPQITLHTGVFYYYCKTTRKTQKKSFCTISACLEHNPSAIWAHLIPVLNIIRDDHPSVVTLHFRSDGPVTQYRNRKNFLLLTKILPKYNIKQASWTFSEAGHGKSPADGIGGLIKRTADRFVSHGNDVVDTTQFVEAIQELKVLHFVINDYDIREVDKLLPQDIPSIPRTLSIHEMVWKFEESNMFEMRYLACTKCSFSNFCSHFGNPKKTWQTSSLPDIVDETSLETFENETLNAETTVTETSVMSTPQTPKLQDYVAVAFEDDWYPGRVIEIQNNISKITFMHRKGTNRFTWPTTEDIQNIPSTEILCNLEEAPVPITARLYSIKRYDEIM